MRRVMLIGSLILVALVAAAIEVGEPLFVQVRDTELRSSAGFLSPIERRLSFGEEVSYLDERSGWVQVALPESETTGWVHAGALKENRSTRLHLEGESTTRTVTSREVALAGRGFSENLENDYGEQRELDFAAVDELEADAVGAEEIVGFVEEAGLRTDFLQEAE